MSVSWSPNTPARGYGVIDAAVATAHIVVLAQDASWWRSPEYVETDDQQNLRRDWFTREREGEKVNINELFPVDQAHALELVYWT